VSIPKHEGRVRLPDAWRRVPRSALARQHWNRRRAPPANPGM